MGSEKGWFGGASIPFLCWAFWAKSFDPDFIIQECTVNFDESILHTIFGDEYDVRFTSLSPVDFGIPASGRRKWSVCVRRSRWSVEVGMDSAAFQQIFFRTMQTYGDIFFQSPEDDVRNFANFLAKKRKLEKLDPNEPIDWSKLLTVTECMNLESYQRIARDTPDKPVLVANLSQKPHMMFSMMPEVPRLMTHSSLLYLVKSPGSLSSEDDLDSAAELVAAAAAKPLSCMTPKESLAVMGWPVFADPQRCVITNALEKLCPGDIQMLAGNAFHVSVVGCLVLTCIFCTSEIVEC
jgi:hypothetical protein